jgi:hypothetical protein
MFLRKLANRFVRVQKKGIAISECVHYCGFPYGRKSFNPYEQYVRSIAERGDHRQRREAFIDFLQFYRPRNMDEALAITSSTPAPLWIFPWNEVPRDAREGTRGWVDDPDDAPDILTHFSEKGILEWRILEEFCWLERAFSSIRRFGYQPDTYNSFIHLLPLVRETGERRYLVLDGNHRLCALSTLGFTKCTAVVEKPVLAENVHCWPGVIGGFYSSGDALMLLDAYFNRSPKWRTTDIPARVLMQFPQ